MNSQRTNNLNPAELLDKLIRLLANDRILGKERLDVDGYRYKSIELSEDSYRELLQVLSGSSLSLPKKRDPWDPGLTIRVKVGSRGIELFALIGLHKGPDDYKWFRLNLDEMPENICRDGQCVPRLVQYDPEDYYATDGEVIPPVIYRKSLCDKYVWASMTYPPRAKGSMKKPYDLMESFVRRLSPSTKFGNFWSYQSTSPIMCNINMFMHWATWRILAKMIRDEGADIGLVYQESGSFDVEDPKIELEIANNFLPLGFRVSSIIG